MERDNVYAKHIRDAILAIESYIQGMDFEAFSQARAIQDAVIRQLEIIGEATKNISPEFMVRYPKIPWGDMAKMRDKLIHEYFGVDIEVVWKTIKEDLPILKNKIEEI